jgi:hypothetical protein
MENKKNKVAVLTDAVILFILGLTPLLWFKPGYSVNGPDVSFPLNPAMFFYNRLFTWNHINGTGSASAINITSIFFHFIQFVFFKLSNSIFFTQRASYCFWFLAICVSMYYFMSVIQRDKPNRLQRFIAVLFYAFNPLVFNIWEVAKAAEISSLVAIPLSLALFIQAKEGRMSYLKSAVIFGLASVGFSEIGASPSVLAIPFGVLAGYMVFMTMRDLLQKKGFKTVINSLGLFLLFGVSFLVFNLYWIMPYGFEIFKTLKGAATASPLEAFNMVNWLKGISTHTSILNITRFQGAWDWYYSWYDEPYVAYAKSFFFNPLMLFLSVFLPALAYLALAFKKNLEVIFFAFVALVATIFATGAHLPYGHIFMKVAQLVPIFLVFRSPYYKFTLATVFAYAFLISVTVSVLYYKLSSLAVSQKISIIIAKQKIKLIPFLFIVLIVASILGYSYPMLTGEIIPKRHSMFSLQLKVPEYVYEASDYLDAQQGDYRIISLPKENLDTYTWGYGAPTNLLNLLCKTPVIWGSASYGGEGEIGNIFYSGLYDNALVNLEEIARVLNVRYLILRNDCWYDFYGPLLSPAELTKRIQKNLGLKIKKSIGEWDFYELAEPKNGICLKQSAFLNFGSKKIVSNLANLDLLKNRILFFSSDNSPDDLDKLLSQDSSVDCFFYNKASAEVETFNKELIKDRSNSFNYIFETSSLPFKPSLDFKLPDYIKVEKMVGIAESSSYDDAQGWKWLLTNKQPNIFINNLSNEDQLVNFSFETFSFMMDRSLYVYLNDVLLHYPMCKADEIEQVRLKRIILKPGMNIISFYTPYPQTTRRARQVTFAFRDFNIGGLEFSGDFYTVKDEAYKLIVYPVSKEDSHLLIPKKENFINLTIDDQKIKLDLTKDFVYVNNAVDLKRGKHVFKINQFLAEDYNIEILSNEILEKKKAISDLKYKMLNPTKYTAYTQNLVDNSYLVFNESYNKNWKLFKNNQPAGLHLQGDGYNNTWLLKKGEGEAEFLIEFWPQRLFYWGASLSGLAVLLGLGYLLRLKLWKK